MNAEQKLLPCPFCGNNCAVLSNTKELGRSSVVFMHAVVCDAAELDGCGAICGFHDEPEQAIAAWNTRPAPTEAEVLAAAKRMMVVDNSGAPEWEYLHPETRREYLDMARAGLGVGHE